MRLIIEVILGVVLTVVLAAAVLAQEPTDIRVRQQQLTAAQVNAINALRDEIYQVPLSRGVTIRDLVEKTGSQVDLNNVIQRAQQIGGPRWLDEQMAKVQIEITGQRLAPVLLQMTNIAYERTPIKTADLQRALPEIQKRTFSATGTSTGVATAEALPPPPNDSAWASVPEASRKAAIASARQNAINRVIDALKPIEVGAGKTVGTELDSPNSLLKANLVNYLNSRPVTSVRFRDDNQVELTLAVVPSELNDVIQSSLPKQNLNPAQLNALRDQVVTRAPTPTGVAAVTTANASVAPTNPVQMVAIPAKAPHWVDRQLTADGSGRVANEPLKSLRAAESDGISKLRAQIDTLHLTPDLTLKEAASRDPRIADAINRALSRVRSTNTDRKADGTVTAKVSFDLADLWNELHNLP